MPVIHQPTPRVLRYARLSGWLFWSIAAGWLLLLSLWISLHLLIVPRIDEFRPWLQEQASKALGMRVELGSITASSQGLVPEFELDNVKILDAAGEVQLNLGRVTLALTPTSALQGEFSQITLEQLDLDVVRDAQGGIRVAGIPLQGGTDPRLSDWVFSQWEWVLRASSINYTDEASGLAPVRMTQIEGVLRNSLLDHRFRLDATPPEALGQRFSVRALFKQPLLSAHAGAWENWTGMVYAQTRQANLQAWQKHVPGSPNLSVQGSGWLRAWLQIKGGKVQGWTQDLALDHPGVNWKSADGSTVSSAFKSASGRLSWSAAGPESWSIQNAHLEPMEGPAWPMKQASVELTRSEAGEVAGGRLKIDALNLAQLQDGMRWVPDPWVSVWLQAEPRGQLQQMEVSWTGSVQQPKIGQWKAQAVDVSLRAGSVSKAHPRAPWPGLSGLTASLSGTASEIQGHVRLEPGVFHWPGLWEDAQKNIRGLEADVRMQFTAQNSRVQLQGARLMVDQGQLSMDADWQGTPSDPLGRLEMTAHAPELEASQIANWLPLDIPSSVRDYVKAAIPQGRVQSVQAKVSGRLADFPFERAGAGEFRISAQLADVKFLTLPKALMDAHEPGEWPTFQSLSGRLLFDRASLKLDKVKARLVGAPNVNWSLLEADIRNLSQGVVHVRAQGRGPLNEMLGWWKSSPLNEWTDRVLSASRSQGVADYRIQLSIPIQKPESTQAQGSVVFGGNELAIAPGAPTLTKVRGGLRFNEAGFELNGVQASLWGGDVRLEGGAKSVAHPAPQVWIRAQGELSAVGLREALELTDWRAPLKSLQGSTTYNAQMQWRRGQLEMQISSLLTGMAIQAPGGLGKKASESMPLRLESRLTPETLGSSQVLQDQVSLLWGQALEARYVRDLSGLQPRVLRGLIRLGAKASSSLPDRGVLLRVASDALDVDAWSDWMQPFTQLPGSGPTAAWDLAPQKVELQSQSVLVQGRQLNRVQLDAQKQGDAWQGRIAAQEMEGELRYMPARGPAPAHFMARLVRLAIPASSHTDTEQFLDQGNIDYPALDIQVQDLDLKGKKLGALEMQAQVVTRSSGTREWQISRLTLSNAEGVFSANGKWHKPLNAAQSQTHFDFKLQLKDSGGLLQRLGTPDAVRGGTGSIEGQITWLGSPATPIAPSMNGRFRVDIERGQFLKTEPGAARLLGVLSLQALPRRLMLDFRDVFSEGFAFDYFRGDVIIEQGIAKSENLQMKGVNAAVMMDGQADIGKETQNLKVLVVPDINAGGAALVYSTINPVIGLTTFIAQYVLRRPIMESTTQQFEIDGTWSEPRVTKVPVKSEAKP